jgi:hypothetical protein
MGCAFLVASLPSHAADRGPSTPEKRRQALRSIHDFEAKPLRPQAPGEREQVINWVIAIPDVYATFCPSILDKMNRRDKKDRLDLIAAMRRDQTEFALMSAEKKDDHFAKCEEGVDAFLNVHAALVKSNPKDRQPFLDELFDRSEAGTLAQFVHDRAAAACKN